MVGEIYDEHDQVAVAPVAGGPALADLDGGSSATYLTERFGVVLPKTTASTVGGMLAELAGRIPMVGERFSIGGVEVDVVAATATRVERVLVRPGPVEAIPLVREPT